MATRQVTQGEKAEEILGRLSSADLIDQAEPVRVAPRTAGTSLRLSVPLLRQLDALAKAQHRTRSNLIQYILWEYIRRHAPEGLKKATLTES